MAKVNSAARKAAERAKAEKARAERMKIARKKAETEKAIMGKKDTLVMLRGRLSRAEGVKQMEIAETVKELEEELANSLEKYNKLPGPKSDTILRIGAQESLRKITRK
jgi:TPP-dependent pyruvate/acetoin dehydrogenase alpha subunit